MKVRMFAPYCYPVPGGQETHVWELSNALKGMGIDASVLTRYSFSRSSLGTALFYARSLPKIGDGADIVHGHDVHVAAAMGIWKLFSGMPSVLTVHSSIFLETRDRWAWFYRKLFSKQKALIGTSRELAGACKPLYDGPVFYIPNGVDTHRFGPADRKAARAGLGLPEDSTIILTTRRLDRKNNVIALAQAFHRLSASDPGLLLVIVGEGEQRAAIESLHNDRIRMVGWVDNRRIADYLHAADLFVMPSLYEATSISCLEAMACGLPVVATKVGGLPDLIDGNGLLCEPTVDGLACAVREVLKGDTGGMGHRSREIAMKGFSWDSIAGRHKQIYEDVLAK